jgi:hypothetical protein
MRLKQYLNEMNQKDRELFVLGRKVQDELNKIMITMTLRPKAKDFDTVAKKLGITKSKTIKAFNVFTWGGMDEATNMQVAKTIQKQLGGKALYMLGAKNLVGGDNFLSFKIGRNSKGVNYIKIKLTSMDLYDVEFGAIRGTNYKIKYEAKGIYADMLHSTIEEHTGMYTSMGTMGR